MRDSNLLNRVHDRVASHSEAAGEVLSRLCEVAAVDGLGLYAVGGILRDIWLDQPLERPLDLDLAVDGDPSTLHAVLAEAASAEPTIHDRFGTATATLADGASIDIARTRTERYPSPGALPIISPAPIGVDLSRRDFTIHAAAMALTGERRGELLDPFGAVRDIEARRIRTLHESSFRDDPTRLIRAARYASRIGGRINERTLVEARRHRRHLAELSPQRFGDAWRLLLEEPNARAAVALARSLKIAQNREREWMLPQAVLKASDTPEMFWTAVGLLGRGGMDEALPQSVGLSRAERAARDAGVALRLRRRRIAAVNRSAAIAASLGDLPDSALFAAQRLWDSGARKAIDMYLERRDSVRSPLSAARLLELGVPEGRDIGHWLARAEAAVWDGELDPSDADAVARFEERIRWAHDHSRR